MRSGWARGARSEDGAAGRRERDDDVKALPGSGERHSGRAAVRERGGAIAGMKAGTMVGVGVWSERLGRCGSVVSDVRWQ